MAEQAKLERDIKTLLESIKLDWQDVESGAVPRDEAVGHVQWCIQQLNDLIQMRDANA